MKLDSTANDSTVKLRTKTKKTSTTSLSHCGTDVSEWLSPDLDLGSWAVERPNIDWLYDRRQTEDIEDSGLDTASTTDSLVSFGISQLVTDDVTSPPVSGCCSQVPSEYGTSVYSTPEVTELLVSNDWLSTNLVSTSPDFTISLVNT